MAFANWRGGVTSAECRSYNQTDGVLLTFDDFAEPVVIERFLAILSDKRVTGAFFIVGNWATENSTSVAKIRAAGHIVGNHSTTHPHLRGLSDIEILKEIKGGVASSLLRPPYGECDSRVRKIAANLGYKLALWSIDSEDWKGLSADSITDRVVRELHPGACVLMHLNGQNTLDALPGLIDAIAAKGYRFWTGRSIG